MRDIATCLGVVVWLAAAVDARAADTLYVTDRLILGLHQAPDTSDRPFKTLESGTALEVLEQNTNYAHVRTPEGVEGWTKVRYLVAEEPARYRLAQLEAEKTALARALEQTKEQLSGADARIEELAQQVEAARDDQASFEQVQEENARFRRKMSSLGLTVPASATALVALAALGLGFAGGFAWLDRRVRRRFNGLRVY